MPGKNQQYNVQSAAENGNGQCNPSFVYGENGNFNDQIVPVRSTRLASTRVEGPEDSDREQWDKPIEFLFSCIAMSVGLGNIWRFPFTAYENGGGAFLIPYLIVLFLIGKPIYFLELAIGQFSSSGQVKVWKMVPFFKGVGYGSAYGTFCVVSYYCFLMALTVFYFFASFSAQLPWSVCNPKWEGVTCGNGNETEFGTEHMNNGSFDSSANYNSSSPRKPWSRYYFEEDVLQQKDNIDDGIGLPEWRLTLCLLASWLIIFGSLVKGVRSSGKVAYFTALFPYAVLFIFLIRGLTLDGALDGILFFIKPKWGRIMELDVWYAAVNQCFFSLSTGFGPIIMFASYNPFKHNVYRDAMIISLMDTFTSLLAGFTIFGILGYLAYELGEPIETVVGGGPSLAFVSYPEAISKFDFVPQLFAVLFFLMLFTLGVGSATSLTSGIITIIHDQFPKLAKSHITAVVCVVGFFSGLIYCTPGGQFMLTLVDYFGAGFVIFAMAMIEIMAIAWVYGLSNICRDIEFMLNIKVGLYWKVCWGFIVPVGLATILTYVLVTAEPLKHDKKDYPLVALVAGWLLSSFAVLLIPLCALHTIATRKSEGLIEKIKESFQPTQSWGPKSPATHSEWSKLPPAHKTMTTVKKHLREVLDRFKKRS